MHVAPPLPPSRPLALEARQRFMDGVCAALPGLDQAVHDTLNQLASQTGTVREMQDRRDHLAHYQQGRRAWVEAATRALQAAVVAPAVATPPATRPEGGIGQLELLDHNVVENRILASRMALSLAESIASLLDTVRQRSQTLDGRELAANDPLRPETVCQLLVDQWVACGLERQVLLVVLDTLLRELAPLLQRQYQAVDAFWVAAGIVPQADLRARVRKAVDAPAVSAPAGPLSSGPQGLSTLSGAMRSAAESGLPVGGHHQVLSHARHAAATGRSGPAAAGGGLLSGLPPLARARQKAQGVMGQLRRFLVHPGMGATPAEAPVATGSLARALTAFAQADTYYVGGETLQLDDHPAVAVVQMSQVVRDRSVELKQKAATAGEKAIIEVVALMFQSILAEDRIPPSVRVWFARLQVPVLRVALAEPDFFSNLDHPARKLIDRMGACVLGFDATAISGSAMEAEIKRIVQVIEQYPETGSRVFQLVYDEFDKFLSRFLTEKQTTSRLVSLAQQVEQRETLAVQYTIELRTMLRDMPVRDEIRDFLYKTWTEVLALSAVRQGVQHEDTVMFKQAASDLVWAASAKPHRSDRAKVIQSLPKLLQRLRQGLSLLGVTGGEQDAQIKVLTDTLADAFLSKTAAIPQAHIDAMARRLANLEDVISDDTLGDLPLNADNIEMLLGIDASSIHVIADTGIPVEAPMLEWARSLPVGSWFTLDHNGASAQVQYAWQSQRKQLHLFAAVDGTSYLIQQGRLAAYLQAGLLVPQDEEGLTLRATRNALAKIDANPERLLG